MKQRFSKKTLGEYISKRLNYLFRSFSTETGHKFDMGNGYAQVRGSSEAANRLYGEIDVMRSMSKEFELPIEIDCGLVKW